MDSPAHSPMAVDEDEAALAPVVLPDIKEPMAAQDIASEHTVATPQALAAVSGINGHVLETPDPTEGAEAGAEDSDISKKSTVNEAAQESESTKVTVVEANAQKQPGAESCPMGPPTSAAQSLSLVSPW